MEARLVQYNGDTERKQKVTNCSNLSLEEFLLTLKEAEEVFPYPTKRMLVTINKKQYEVSIEELDEMDCGDFESWSAEKRYKEKMHQLCKDCKYCSCETTRFEETGKYWEDSHPDEWGNKYSGKELDCIHEIICTNPNSPFYNETRRSEYFCQQFEGK